MTKPIKIYELKAGQYMSDVVHELPHGIINKGETGIGATTLELNSARNSIIVEPLKVTASSKAHKHGACYVGSPTLHFPEKGRKAKKKRIEDYLNDPSKKPKKFVVVADSLQDLMSIIPKEDHHKYFLMIDESDRTQLDVGYRSNMEEVNKIYKMHKLEMRCMITATPVKYHDPDLSSETYTEFKLSVPSRRDIDLTYSDNSHGLITDKIQELYTKTDEKVVVALNQVTTARSIADKLVEQGVKDTDIHILCSHNSKKTAGPFYKELEEAKLPARIVIKTSAYFNGFDLDEQYHLMTYTSSNDPIHMLSTDTMKQIAGRCRHKDGLLSENVFYQNADKARFSHKMYTFEKLSKEAERLKAAYMCFDSYLKHSEVLKHQAETLFKTLSLKLNLYGLPLIVMNKNMPEISYLGIDAILEVNRVMNTHYNRPNSLETQLSKENNVTPHNESSTTTLDTDSIKKATRADEKKEVDKLLSSLISFSRTKHPTGEKIGISANELLRTGRFSSTIKGALKIYDENRECVNNDELKELILKAFDKSKPGLHLKKLYDQLTFIVGDDKDTMKKAVMTTFEEGEVYSTEDILRGMKNMVKGFTTTTGKMSNIQLKKLFNIFVETKLTSQKGIQGRVHKVVGYNTLGVKVIEHIKEYRTAEDTLKKLTRSQPF